VSSESKPPPPPLRVVIIAGPNGSGKSTLIRQLRADPVFEFPANYINADDIAQRLGSRSTAMPDAIPTQREREDAAFHEARDLRAKYREEGASHAFETVFSHPSTLRDMELLRECGFHVTLYFVTTESSEINVQRVIRRVLAGGHDVPADKIRDRYGRVMRLLPRAAETASQAYIYDASSDVARLVCTIRDGVVRLPDHPPDYLVRALLEPLEQRAQERMMLEDGSLEGEPIELPDEQKGVYTGLITQRLRHYVLQRCTGRATLLRHDISVLAIGEATSLTEGARYRIAYKEGRGEVSPVSLED
jgi:predicted ABC-type ATPase